MVTELTMGKEVSHRMEVSCAKLFLIWNTGLFFMVKSSIFPWSFLLSVHTVDKGLK